MEKLLEDQSFFRIITNQMNLYNNTMLKDHQFFKRIKMNMGIKLMIKMKFYLNRILVELLVKDKAKSKMKNPLEVI